MPFLPTHMPGLLIYEPVVHYDDRGYFFESYNQLMFQHEAGIDCVFVQDNQSYSVKNVLRGLHYQNPPLAQGKLVRVLSGEILDVTVDIRRGSPTYGRHYRVRLSAGNRRQLWIPPGFAHGFLVQSESAEVLYKCDQPYSPEHEAGILFSDPALAIEWDIDISKVILSQRDAALPTLDRAVNRFEYGRTGGSTGG
ncbi:dTDP-4-dehydrorhamnose 3,5-epimerase [bacterium]|nr:dTDP-4-dehydrorhamnose 3,5-epimerase [bacterium]